MSEPKGLPPFVRLKVTKLVKVCAGKLTVVARQSKKRRQIFLQPVRLRSLVFIISPIESTIPHRCTKANGCAKQNRGEAWNRCRGNRPKRTTHDTPGYTRGRVYGRAQVLSICPRPN